MQILGTLVQKQVPLPCLSSPVLGNGDKFLLKMLIEYHDDKDADAYADANDAYADADNGDEEMLSCLSQLLHGNFAILIPDQRKYWWKEHTTCEINRSLFTKEKHVCLGSGMMEAYQCIFVTPWVTFYIIELLDSKNGW